MCFDEYFIQNYDRLIRLASRCDYPEDVVHDLYIEGKKYDIENLDAWWNRAIYTRTTKAEYYNSSLPLFDLPAQPDTRDIEFEDAFNALDHLDELDRSLFLLYLQGYCMSCVAEKTKIPQRVIYYSIKKAKECLQAKKSSDNG